MNPHGEETSRRRGISRRAVLGGAGAGVAGGGVVAAGMLGRSVAAAGAGPRVLQQPVDLAEHITRPAGWGQRWLQARTEAGVRQVRVHVWGGSVTQGNPGNSDPLTTSWPGLVFAELQDTYGNGGTGYVTTGYASNTTGLWQGQVGFASVGSRATAAASLRWEDLRGTRMRLWHRNQGTDGEFRWRIDGGPWRHISPPTGFGYEPGVDWFSGQFDMSDTPHTVDVEWLSGEVVIYGVECSHETGIVPCRCAIGGRAAAHFGLNRLDRVEIGLTGGSDEITSPAPGVFTSSLVGRYLFSTDAGLPPDAQVTAVAAPETATISAAATETNTIMADLSAHPPSWADYPRQTVLPTASQGLDLPDLLLVGWGVNDMAYIGHSDSGTVSTDIFRDGASQLLKAYYGGSHSPPRDYSPDLVVVGEHLAAFGDPFGSGPQVASTAKRLAAGLDGAYVDFWATGRRSFEYASDQGWMADTVHPNDDGAEAMADPIIALLTSTPD